MDLFQAFIREHGRISPDEFQQHRHRFLFDLMDRWQANPALDRWRSDIGAMREYMEAHNARRKFWRDSELYPPVHELATSQDDRRNLFLLALLQVLTGMAELGPLKAQLPDGHYRLRNLAGAVYRLQGGHLTDVTRRVLMQVPGFRPDVYYPASGLFADFLSRDYYPDLRPGARIARSHLRERMQRAVRILRGHSAEIHRNLQAALSCVVLAPRGSTYESSNLGIRHFGAVYVNPHVVDDHGIVEGLVHEYYHNCSWLYWTVVPPGGRPAPDVHITSPMTGNVVQAFSMIDALMIYVDACRFHLRTAERLASDDPPVARAAHRRAQHLRTNLPVLHRRLNEVVPRRSAMGRFIAFTMAYCPGA